MDVQPRPRNPVDRASKTVAPRGADTASHLEALLDEALAETFPASDPVALLWRGGAAPEDI